MILVALLAGIVAGIASASISRAHAPSDPAQITPSSSSVEAVRALINRCLPRIGNGREMPLAGLRRLTDGDERGVLAERVGRVWMLGDELLVIDFSDVPVCRVVALSVEPLVLADLVTRVFREGDGVFRRERFKLYADGGFAAVYSAAGHRAPVTVRISTGETAQGVVFASLDVEGATGPAR